MSIILSKNLKQKQSVKLTPSLKKSIDLAYSRIYKYHLNQKTNDFKILDNLGNQFESKFFPIEKFGIDGDYIESQAFAYLAIRSFLNLPLSFPNTTGCTLSCTGGILTTNY